MSVKERFMKIILAEKYLFFSSFQICTICKLVTHNVTGHWICRFSFKTAVWSQTRIDHPISFRGSCKNRPKGNYPAALKSYCDHQSDN